MFFDPVWVVDDSSEAQIKATGTSSQKNYHMEKKNNGSFNDPLSGN